MSLRKSWSRRKRVSGVVLTVVALATSAWGAISHTESSLGEAGKEESRLEAPIPPPQDVFIQAREDSDGLGNAFVLVQLSQEQVAAKRKDGTADFLTLGTEESTVILRDDGVGGDTKAGDGLYTGISEVDLGELRARAAQDQEELERNPDGLVPVFAGRAAIEVTRPAAFDFNGFARGERVLLNPSVAFIGQENISAPPISSELPVVPGTNAFQERVLMITSTSVVSDSSRTWNPCTNTGNGSGVWTFNHLMTEMSPNLPPSFFVRTWLETWTSTQNFSNGASIPARSQMQEIIDRWPTVGGDLDLTKSPLRLLAIVPRLDVRKTTGGGGGYSSSSGDFKDGGELRFIFGFVAKSAPGFDPVAELNGVSINGTSCYALPFTVIFEYRFREEGCENIRSWARQWKALAPLNPGNALTPGYSTSYNQVLEDLTEQVVPLHPDSTLPNKSWLAQLRTNEVALGAPWELRQFELTSQGMSSLLEPAHVSDTIQNAFNHDVNSNGLLRSRINDVKVLLDSNFQPVFPPTFEIAPTFYQLPGTPPGPLMGFLAGSSRVEIVPFNPAIPNTGPDYITFHWSDPNLSLDVNDSVPATALNNLKESWARHHVSMASCNGCHNQESFTHFVHVNPADTIIQSNWVGSNWSPIPILRANPALPAELSLFLTGINQLADPANGRQVIVTSPFGSPIDGDPKRNFDDLARRELDLNNVAGLSCFRMIRANMDSVARSLQETGRLPDNLFEGVALDERRSVGVDDMKRNAIKEVH